MLLQLAAAKILRNNWLRDIFVGAQVAMSLVLLVGATLLLRSLMGVLATEIGLDPQTVAIASPVFAPGDYKSGPHTGSDGSRGEPGAGGARRSLGGTIEPLPHRLCGRAR